jgi:hypothetical protein
MRRIAFNPRFVNEAGTDLVEGKIHTIRKAYPFWKKFEGQDVALFTWEGKPYRSKQRVFCVKKLVSVQEVFVTASRDRQHLEFFVEDTPLGPDKMLDNETLAKNDGFSTYKEFESWFLNYPEGIMAVLHFTDFEY